MLLLPLLLSSSMAAAPAPEVLIVERSTLGVPPATGAQLRERLGLVFSGAGLAPQLGKERCADRACLLRLAEARGACAVGVTLVKNRQGLTVDVEAVDGGQVVLQQTFLLGAAPIDESPDARFFAERLAGRLRPDRPVVEPPPEAQLIPARRPEPEALRVAEVPAPLAPKVIGGASVAVSALGLGLLIGGGVVKGGLDAALAEQPVVSSLTRPQAEQQAALANGLMAGGAIALGLGVAGTITALALGW